MNAELSRDFGLVIREKRIILKISQEELAFRAGVHRTYVGMVERGEKNISLENISKFASALECPLSEIFLCIEKISHDVITTHPRIRG